jgi:5'-3' exonuclease
VKEKGLNKIIDSYVKILDITKTHLLNDEFKINDIFFEMFIDEMVTYEKTDIVKIFNKQNKNRYDGDLNDEHKKKIWEIENMKFDVKKPFVVNDSMDTNAIKNIYNRMYLGIEDYYEETIDEITTNYLNGLMWNISYYFKNDQSKKWCYEYHIAPFFSDIANYVKLKLNNKQVDSDVLTNKLHDAFVLQPTEFVSVKQQMMMIMPMNCIDEIFNVHDKKMLKKEENMHVCYDNLIVDVCGKTVYWKCYPFLLPIDINTINKIVDDKIIN